MMTLRRLFSVCALLAVGALAACGGGGGNTTPFGGDAGGGGGGTTPPPVAGTPVADLVIVLASGTLANNSSAPVSATVTALDANRNAVSGAAVTLAANANAVVTVTSGATTNALGQLLATVSYGSDTTPRTVTLTAASGSVTKTAALQIVSGASVQPAAIDLVASANSVGTGGETVTIQAFVKDASNNALANAPVVFNSSTGTLASVSPNTNASGVATATFSSGSNKANRNATITVTSQTVTASLTLPITDTKLTLSGPSSALLGSTIDYTVTAVDSKGNPVAGATITSASSLAGNAITRPNGDLTAANGTILFRYVATNAGTDSGLTFSGLGTSVKLPQGLVISGDDFVFLPFSPLSLAEVAVNTLREVSVRLRVGGLPQAGRTVSFAATGGVFSQNTAITNALGVATTSIQSSSAGPITVQASVLDIPGGPNIITRPTQQLTVVAKDPSFLVLQIAPNALPINSIGGNGNNTAQVIARVTDVAANPVANILVNFSRLSDPSGGNLLQASATTDSNGVAIVTYRSGPESTASNGVVLRGTVASNQAIAGNAALTVNQSALFITLGTGNVIENLDPQTYKKDWVVYVTDANGVAVNNVSLTIKVLPLTYRTGRLAWNGVNWAYTAPIFECTNEDRNSNGVLNPRSEDLNGNNTLDAGEDTNGNGVLDLNSTEDDNGDGALTPGNVVAVTPATVQTANGRATVSNIYAESLVPWTQVRLTASATVAGTESKRDAEFVINGAAADFTNEAVPPAGVISPFGLLPLPALTAGTPLPAVGGTWPTNTSCRRIQ